MLDRITENCAEPLVDPLATCRLNEKREKLEKKKSSNVRLYLAFLFYLHKVKGGSARLGKSVASFIMIRVIYQNFHRARTPFLKCIL